MPIEINTPGVSAQRARKTKRLIKAVHEACTNGRPVVSASGASMALAVEWFERNQVPYVIQAMPGVGYTIQELKNENQK